MRFAVLIAALACASAAHADGARENRYGPAPARAPTAIDGRAPLYNGASYGGRTLGWTGKRDTAAATAGTAQQQQPWWSRQQAQPQAQRPQAAAATGPAGVTPQAPAPSAPLPQSLYDTPPPNALGASAQPAVAAAPAFQPGQVGARTYSVGRQFGMSPDPIPAAGPSRMVLIAPPPVEDEEEAGPSVQNGGEWSGRAEKDGDLQ
ncbi:hypothetical protein [Caulobacter vibrioides]|uniref:Translation initiation factor IF-2 n=2 Tax=Caulobacter vibrioides TaxID=155892 RepID=Q9A533_CAUVC|nr:hypothetical protein [Caulobacter vibrioides]YP_002518092.1 hypothetical protein CCNA_02719 [Caulobacter vibrioides NA1000]QBQ57303.1 hypothetical protein EUX21_02915 [synthetic Caulobacter sp. 'ethensis']AAK24603.1 hypothetical protein CC_2636 [Caulobacter vibrioides CB15]ACL96184.1 hypothetical protein CCNA_02719 [Caulobacter vibrioides NA1000]ATC29479.1 hypothetical protein CA607_14270 [Caulobacter vibrioides]QXZ50998.1 hypothetical protein KZH45_14015 [Caulobacter vibrioides]